MNTDTGVAGLFRTSGGVGLGLGRLIRSAADFKAERGSFECTGLVSSNGNCDSFGAEGALVAVADLAGVRGGLWTVDVDAPLASALSLSSLFACSAARLPFIPLPS